MRGRLEGPAEPVECVGVTQVHGRAAADARERFSLDEIVADYEKFYEYTLARPSAVERQSPIDLLPVVT